VRQSLQWASVLTYCSLGLVGALTNGNAKAKLDRALIRAAEESVLASGCTPHEADDASAIEKARKRLSAVEGEIIAKGYDTALAKQLDDAKEALREAKEAQEYARTACR